MTGLTILTKPAVVGKPPTVASNHSVTPAPVLLVMAYIVIMPFLAGLPRGTVIPLMRPSEALQLSVTAAAIVLGCGALAVGRRWQLRLRPVEWWMVAMATAASVLPVLWLLARGLPVGQEELLGAFPFVKYAMLYFFVRACITSATNLETLSRAVVLGACLLALVAITQALTIGPVIDFLGRFYVDGVEDLVDEGRGTTTIGSSIATGAFLSFSCGLALSWGLASGRRLWFAATAFLTIGTLASGQAGSVIALGVVVLTVAHLHGRTAQLFRWGIPAGLLAIVGLWPVVAARLSDIDQGTGLPSSWIIRWNNISELYLPSLGDGGWILGVSPDAILAPPDVWRETIYLESGYLWLLWVGGIPLLVSAGGFLISAWRLLGRVPGVPGLPLSANPVAVAAKGAVAMMLLLSLIDPHLSLRGGADLFFVLVALGLAASPMTEESPVSTPLLRRLVGTALVQSDRYPAVRVLMSEVPAGGDSADETGLRLTARTDGLDVGSCDVRLFQHHGKLRAATTGPVVLTSDQTGDETSAILWRTTLLVADSLRLHELRIALADSENQTAMPPVLGRGQLKIASKLAEKLEIERSALQHRVQRAAQANRATEQTSSESSVVSGLPGLRLDPGYRVPAWKRLLDLTLGSLVTVGTAPLWILCAVAVRRSSPGPALYRQLRVGTGGFPFQIFKFRTMYLNNDDSAHREQNRKEILENADAVKDDADPRITPVGRVLRRTSLDELPQLINVLRSDMSLVGPRPSLLWETELFRPQTRRRLRSRPGITGLWQVNGRADLSMSEMLDLDLDYVDQMGPGLDLRCLAKTATSVIAGEGAR